MFWKVLVLEQMKNPYSLIKFVSLKFKDTHLIKLIKKNSLN